MAAGLGFKDFTTGEVLTAADVDGYLMQGVWVFASAAARDAAVTSPQEGNFAYLKDTNVTTYYTGSAWANLDTTGMTNPMTTTGDTIYSSSGSTPARLGIGSTGQVLTVAGGVPTWATPAGGSTAAGCSLTKSSNQTLSNATATAVSFDGENFDTDGYHDNATNNSRITIPAGKGGKYVVSARATFATNTTDQRRIQFKVNGSATAIDLFTTSTGVAGEPFGMQTTRFLSLSAGDYVEMFAYQASGGDLTLYGDSGAGTGVTFFGAMYLGA